MQNLSRSQRLLVFVMVFGGGLLLIIGLFMFLSVQSINSGRPVAQALIEGVTVHQAAALPGDDAYPASVTIAPDGTVYTGSYANGTVWAIAPDGTVTALDRTLEEIGAATGLTMTENGTLLVVDQLDVSFNTVGGDVKAIAPDGTISTFADLADFEGFLVPDDIAVDAAGRVYVTDRGQGEVWRFEADGSGALLWWSAPANDAVLPAPTGIAYDPVNDAMLITDSDINAIYRVAVTGAGEVAGETSVVYQHSGEDAPGFDGLTVRPDGEIYVAALGLNRVAWVDQVGQTLMYLAGNFRGASDVAYDPMHHRLYVANWDQTALGLSLFRPRLPFGIDAVVLP